MSDLVGNPEDRFSRVAAHISKGLNMVPVATLLGSWHYMASIDFYSP